MLQEHDSQRRILLDPFDDRQKVISQFGHIRCAVFEAMHRNALPATEFFRIPANRVVELGGQIEI